MVPLLSLAAVRASHRRGRHEVVVLDDASLDVHAHDFACVLGARSAGKTTLLEVAAGLRRPDRGTVRYAGRDLRELGSRARSQLRRSEIACVWNRPLPAVHAASALEHVALPLVAAGTGWRERRRAAAMMLERVGAGDHARSPLDALSGGERTRVALAQACVRSPRMLLADEIADTLDLGERNAVLGLLQSFARDGVAVLLSAADAHGAAGCERLIALDGGRLVEAAGPAPADVLPFRRRSGGRSADRGS